MIYDDLYNETLIKPVKEGANILKIISGYATAAMAFHHFEDLKSINSDVKVSLLVGMCPSDGLSINNHRGFQDIVSSQNTKFSCSYIFKNPVHSKLYIWYKNESLYKAFIGSANYTQTAFYAKQREILAEIHDANVTDYYSMLEKDSIFCTHNEMEDFITLYNDKHYYKVHIHEEHENIQNKNIHLDYADVEHVTISLLSAQSGDIQHRGGLNWGQRKGRNPNQAYIQLPPKVYKSDFFPQRRQHFTVVTDDSKIFICTRAQKQGEGNAIETPHNNSLLGEYFRNRLGLPYGAFITKADLERYGRTDVTFYKFDSENYYMDFSV